MKVKHWHIAVFILALIGFGIASAPASLLLPQREGIAYARANGTVWSARLEGLQVGPYSADRASWRLSALDVVQGKAIVPIDFEEGTIEGRLVLLGNWQGDRRFAAHNLRLDGLRIGDRLTLPGQTVLNGVDVLFEGGTCVRAQGRISSDVFARAGQAVGWTGPLVEGRPRCEGDNAVINLDGANPVGERVNVRIILMGDGAAAWRVSVQTDRRDTVAALTAVGFSPGVVDPALGYGEETRWLP